MKNNINKKGRISIISIMFITVIIGIIIFTIYIVLANNTKFKFRTTASYIFNEADRYLDISEKSPLTNVYNENKVNVTGKITAKLSLSDDILNSIGYNSRSIQDIINSSTLEANSNVDLNNKYIDTALNYSYNNEKLSASLYIDNDQMYMYYKNIYDKYLEISGDDLKLEEIYDNTGSKLKISEIRYLVSILKKSVSSSLNYGKYTNSKVMIDVDGKEKNVKKSTLTIDTEFKYKFESILIDNILYDNKAKEILLKLVDANIYPDVASLESAIRDELINIQSTNYTNEVIGEYSIYSTGMFGMIVRNEFKYFGDKNLVLQYTTYKTTNFDSQLLLYENEEAVSQINIKENKRDNYNISIKFGQDANINLQGTIKKSLIDLQYLVAMSGKDDIKGNIKDEMKNISKKEMNHIFTVTLDTPDTYGTANLTLESTIKVIDNITKPDFSNSININEMTSNDSIKMMMNASDACPTLFKTIDDTFGTNFSSARQLYLNMQIRGYNIK